MHTSKYLLKFTIGHQVRSSYSHLSEDGDSFSCVWLLTRLSSPYREVELSCASHLVLFWFLVDGVGWGIRLGESPNAITNIYTFCDKCLRWLIKRFVICVFVAIIYMPKLD